MKEHLIWRYGVKRYDTQRKVTPEDIRELQNAIRLAPSSYGLQPFKVLFISDQELRAKLSIASFHQPQVTEASCLAVFAVETDINEIFIDAYFNEICQTRGVKLEGNLLKHRDSVVSSINRKSEEEKCNWASHQAYLALGFMLMEAAYLKIDVNAMEGFMPLQYDEILGLKDSGLRAAVIAGIGHRHSDDLYQHQVKVRRPENEIFINL
ncbi:NAD(P)H-dependent oxidoreductase [Mucilaginibacter aquaedulcis]|uniref:NAD(P)H-dependent oxidoreductase n=1 Tax=Mucilaginibacter aquaedulcis TaxID=1187081 RepID=UPI0025B3D18D|nr:NAD(P)H-dependent oxidoreductase [Mucilaginibacter aquaedulcis]MDN3550017.1 NAD(P)H-dependent oxidoreductase [Mucilaginibacter aquaedulcis]